MGAFDINSITSQDVIAKNPALFKPDCGALTVTEEESARIAEKLEGPLQDDCETVLLRHEIAFLHLSCRAREKKGWPDLTFVINGQPYAVELKSATGTLSGEQKTVLAMMGQNGWNVCIIRNAEDFHDLVTRALRGTGE